MKAIVCVKQVPDTQGKVAVKADGTMDRAAMATITNPDDLNAVEAALQLKDETGCEVVVVTMGPPPAEGMLRELIARGADRGVLVSGREFGGSDTFATSQILAAAVNKIGVGPEDIVFCGRQAIDGDTAQVGPQIAEKLHLPQVTYVTDIKKEGNSLVVKRQLEDGYMELKVNTPCLLTCIKELNNPRYMSVSGIFECYDKPIDVFDYNTLKDDPAHRDRHHRPQGLPDECLQVLCSSGQGRRHDGRGCCPAGRHPERQAPDLRRGENVQWLNSMQWTPPPSRACGSSASSAKARSRPSAISC